MRLKKVTTAILLVLSIGIVSADPPNWIDNPGGYEFTATIVGGIVLDESGTQMGECETNSGFPAYACIDDTQDIFAAFDEEGNVRGVGIMLFPPFGPYQGTPVFEVQLRSNAEGDLLHFKYYDASEDAILDIVETYEFVINDILGDVINPIFFNIGSDDEECVDDDAAVGGGDCAWAVANFGCDMVWGESTIGELCPETCGLCDDEPPEEFQFNSSMLQAFYFFNLVLINDIEVESNDWVGAFKGDVCVGARQWDTSLCGYEVCEVPVMGDDGSELTAGYMITGEFPTFKIYDSSENIYYNAIPSEEMEWSNNGFNLIDGLNTYSSVQGCMDQDACNYNPNATEDDGSCLENDCAGECGGSAEMDECGVCGGDGIADGACDCEGNVDLGCGCNLDGPSGCDMTCESTLENDECGVCGGDNTSCSDCAGIPNGDAELDDCEVCNGGNADDLGCGCFQPGPSGCDNACGSTLENDECGVCGGGGADVMCEDGSYVCEANDCPDELDECMDDPNTCIWNNVYNNYDNQEDCEENGGIWGGYLEYFNTSCEEMVNLENGCGIQILYWTVSALCPASCGVCCDDEDACNHDGEGSCEYAEENYDCDGNYCTAGEDCAGECGGSAVIDECGICEGDGIPAGECDCDGNVDLGCGCDEPAPSGCDNVCGSTAEVDECGECGGDGLEEGFNCDGSPELFNYNNSILQAFYYFTSVTINGENVESADWVGAFNGDICVGARKWDTSLCNSGVCDVPVMGQDGWEETEGYMLPGDFPTFKIYDASAGEYYDAVASEEYTWVNMGFNNIDNLNGVIFGCTDPISCNYIAEATMDDGSCLEFDCTGDCGGSAVLDECGVCNGNGAEDGFSCGGIPLEFVFNQSSLQAFYYIYEASDLAGNPLTAEDWVGAFNGDICVGSRQWDTSLCNNGICDVPAMGDDGYDYSEGYLLPGDLPSFKIYDYSEGDYFDAYPSENYPYENTGLFNIDELVLDLSYSIPLTQYNNLMSFYVLPEDILVSNVMLDIQENIVAISGEATSAQYFIEGDYWTGTLMNLDISSGYWMRVAEEDTLDGSGHSYDPGRVYNLHSGANLVSFPSIGNVGISAGLPDEFEANVLAILGEGMSTVNSDEGWEGSLLDFKALHGYWIITDEEISFSYNLDSLEPLSRKVNPYLVSEIPHGFDYIQSTQQAFYYVEDIKLINGEIENGDWLFSYCGNTVTGARQWLGKKVDIPAMGTEGDMMTAGYCGTNDTPHFKLLKSNGQKLIALHAETPKWQPNGIFFLGSLEEAAPLPNEFVMFAAYPNPFNPITQMRYEIPAEGNLEISIFDLRGQKVETLVNKFIQPGEYTANWDASHVASGVYFVHFTALGEGRPPISQIQKLMLVK